MKHLVIHDDEAYTLLYALRCGKMELRELENTFAEKSDSSSADIMRACHKMRMTLIRLENQIDPDANP